MKRIRIYKNGEKVIVTILGIEYKMIVMGAIEELGQWKYQLAYQRLSGKIDNQKSHRFFYADKIKKQLEPLKIS